MLFDAFDVYMIGVVGVLITSFAVSDATFSYILSASYVGQMFGTLVLGWLSEHYGRKPGFIWAIGSFGFLSILAVFAWSAESLIWIRVLQGIGIGALPPLAGAMLSAVHRGYDLTWLDEYPGKINALTTADVNAAIKKHLKPENMILIKAGTVPGAPAK
jgi:MFS family permease